MTPKERAAMQQALAYIELTSQFVPALYDDDGLQASAALRKALEQPVAIPYGKPGSREGFPPFEPFEQDAFAYQKLEQPVKPEECANGCPPLQVCDYCQRTEQPVSQEPVKRFTSDDVKVAFENGYAAAMSVVGVAKEAQEQSLVVDEKFQSLVDEYVEKRK